MHWLAGQLEIINQLKGQYQQHTYVVAKEGASVTPLLKESKDAFFLALHRLVEDISKRPGIIACFISNEGLLVESHGVQDDLEGLAAMSQLAINSAGKICDSLNLGPLQQTIVVGSMKKVALFSLGEVEVGILSLTNTNLSKTLS
ncbi:MAG: roadblock/LC7 domain-containing protein [bacterium]|nr:roadblock/LC7 domain-containing protein [bacterium]